jgi:hypothetical protein
MKLVLLLQLLVVGTRGAEIAFDLFQYSGLGESKSTNGGVGFQAAWTLNNNCDDVAFSAPTGNSFTFFTSKRMIGGTISAGSTGRCEMVRTLSDTFPTGVNRTRFISVLFTVDRSISPRQFFPVLSLAVGDLSAIASWDRSTPTSFLTLARDGRVHQSDRAVSFDTILDSDLLRSRLDSYLTSGTPPLNTLDVNTDNHFFIVMKLVEGTQSLTVRAAVYNADSSAAVTETALNNANSVSFPFLDNKWSLAIGSARTYVSQLRVGTTFSSVYDEIPTSLTTTLRTATASTMSSSTTRTTTSTTTSSSSSSSSTTSTTTTTPTTTVPPRTAPSATPTTTTIPPACNASTSCSSCLELASCKWCSTVQESSAGRCTADVSGCAFLTLMASGCAAPTTPTAILGAESSNSGDNVADDQSLPVAVIGGAVGGGIAALLIVALVICLVLRARRQKPNAEPSEMATAREANSVATSHDSLYGDLRLTTNIYSAAGLGTPGGSVDLPPSAASSGSGSTAQAHYSPMEMSK